MTKQRFGLAMNLQQFAGFGSVIEKRQEHHELHDKAKAIHEKSVTEKRAMTTDETREFDSLMAQVKTLSDEIRQMEDQIAAGAKEEMRNFNYGGAAGKDPRIIGPETRMASLVQATAEERQLSIGKFVKGLVTGEWAGAEPERRAMSEGTLSAGGYMVPQILSANVIDLARNQARIFQAGAQIVKMDSNKVTMARVTGDPTANFKAENTHGTFSDMSFDPLNFDAKTLIAMVKVSEELLMDAQDIDTVIYNALSEALALKLDYVALYGTGTAPDPRGLKNTTGIIKTAVGPNGGPVTVDLFTRAIQAIRERNGEPNAAIYAPRTAGSIESLKDSTGQPLQLPESFKNLAKYSTNQVPTNLTQGTAVGTATDAILGDFSQLLIGMRTQFSLQVSREAAQGPDSAFTQHQVWIKAVLRADVQVSQPGFFNIIEGII